MKHSQSMPRAMDNMSVNSNFSIRTSMLASLNAKDKIPDHYIQKVASEADVLMESIEPFKKIWEDIKKMTASQNGLLSSSNFVSLFKKYHHVISPIFHLSDAKDFFEILDEDNDGFLNEDEQVLLFSLFKSKMLHCSQKLLLVFDYKRFHELMVCVRALEHTINAYQDALRTNIYDHEIKRYREVGHEKLDDFLDRYTQRFEVFMDHKRQRIHHFELERQREREEMEREITSDTHMVKFKPRRELKDYLVNERLVALEERIEEAANFRKELEKLSSKEAIRLNKNMGDYVRSNLHRFDLSTERRKKHLLVKIDNEENKLKIKMAKEFDVLIKKIALHENDIKRIQTMSKKKAIEKGKNQGELIRLKQTLRKQNEIIVKSRRKEAEEPTSTAVVG